ncbi:MAG: Flp family type IVb pilin [Pirellulaceae bacterium]|nr:Flp family type IVb pilin [Pirellulaceae bacterium]MDP7018465.1 Flp family type IVb pilin [Pirellulaceae bacterium]
MNAIRRFLTEEDGPTAVEYAVMLALILLVCIAGIRVLGTNVNSSFDDSKSKIESAMGS